jgi:hypothetical protein
VTDAADWARFGLEAAQFVFGMAFSVISLLITIVMVRAFWGFFSEGRRGDFPATRVLFRRIWCRHRVLSNVRSRYGYRTKLCAACGVDVNRGKPWELRR